MNLFTPRVVYDCNVFVSALLNATGVSRKCFDLARESRVALFGFLATINEIRDVIVRPGILLRLPDATYDQIEAYISEILYISQTISVTSGRFSFHRDPKDQIIIDLALEAEADFIVTNDRDLLDLMTGIDVESKQFRQRFRHLKIVKT